MSKQVIWIFAVLVMAALPASAQNFGLDSPDTEQNAGLDSPASEQQVELDSWDFDSKPELVERLNETQTRLDEKIQKSQESNHFGMVSDLERAKQDVIKAIDNVQNAEEETWDTTLTYVESDFNDYDLYEYGIYEDGYWEYEQSE